MSVAVLILSGPVGVGKTTTAHALSGLLQLPHAVIDVDALTWCHPTPAGDPFQEELALKNLAALWPNYRHAGATHLILVRVIEDAATLAAYRAIIPDSWVVLARLEASPAALEARIAHRAAGAELPAERDRAHQLAELLARAHLEDVVVDTTGRSPEEVAAELLRRTGFGAGGS